MKQNHILIAIATVVTWQSFTLQSIGQDARIMELQQKLSAAGFDPKGVDGRWGPGTEAALKAYQAANSLPQTGRIEPGSETATKLGIALPRMADPAALQRATALGKLALKMAPVGCVEVKDMSDFAKDRVLRPAGLDSKYSFPKNLAQLIEQFRKMLENGSDPTLVKIADYSPPESPFMLTANDGKKVVVDVLHGTPGKIVPASQDGMTLFEYFGKIELMPLCALLDEKHGKPDEESIHAQSAAGNLEAVMRMIEMDAGLIESRDYKRGLTPTDHAAERGYIGVVDFLLGKGAARSAAVEKTLQTARVAVESEHPDERCRAIADLRDEALFERVAVKDADPQVRAVATGKVENADLLATIACSDTDAAVRRSAAQRLRDEAVLERVATEDSDADVRLAAVSNLTSGAVLAKVAAEDKDPRVRRMAAARCPGDEVLLGKVATENADDEVRAAAAVKLTDQNVLVRIALEDKVAEVRKAALVAVTDQQLLARVAMESPDASLREGARDRLTDRDLKIAVGMWLDPKITGQVTDQAQLARIAVEAKDPDVRCAAVKKLIDSAVLARVAVYDLAVWVRGEAVRNASLTDQAVLAKVAQEEEKGWVRVAAVGKLTDQALLTKLAAEDGSKEVKQAANKRLAALQAGSKSAQGKDQ